MLSDDWELRGDGSGSPRDIQFKTLNRLIDVYDQFGIKGTFNVEVMQQLYHLKFSTQHSELAEIASEWESVVKAAYRRGHDIQLHLHPQWIDATYQGGKWQLISDWAITNHNQATVGKLVSEGINYLHNLLRPINPDYRCVSYRGGSWSFAPSDFLVQVLSRNNILFDMSIVRGLFRQNTLHVDYREIEEPNYPYYPLATDARKVGPASSGLVCVPTHSLLANTNIITLLLRQAQKNIRNDSLSNLILSFLPSTALPVLNAGYNMESYKSQFMAKPKQSNKWKKFSRLLFDRNYRITDLSALSYLELKASIKDIRKRHAGSGMESMPYIIASHTKNMGHFKGVARFAKLLKEANDIQVITATQLARNIQDNVYKIRSRKQK